MVVVPCARIPGDGDFVHDVEGKICVDLGLYNDLDLPFRGIRAEVVELVDALASGASGRKPVGVRVPPSALPPRHGPPARLSLVVARPLPRAAGARAARRRQTLRAVRHWPRPGTHSAPP